MNEERIQKRVLDLKLEEVTPEGDRNQMETD
jgi:hypothetical protein